MKEALIGGVAALALVATLAWAASATGLSDEPANCLTQADVMFHLERSRTGISLSCNEAIRTRNLQQEIAR